MLMCTSSFFNDYEITVVNDFN